MLEFGYGGTSPSSMFWAGALPATERQLEAGSYFGDRTHVLLFDGGYDTNKHKDWCYVSAHDEHWDGAAGTHYIDSNGFSTGKQYFEMGLWNTYTGGSYYGMNIHNDVPGFYDANSFLAVY